jgi:hypothetical protein
MRRSTAVVMAAFAWMETMLGIGWGISECAAASPNVAGRWLGTIKTPGLELRIAFEISETKEGGYTAVVHSIDQGAMNISMSLVTLNGGKDCQVPPKENLGGIEKELKAGGNSDCTVRELPGLNHLLQTCGTGATSEYIKIEETMSPLALQTVSDWIIAKTGTTRKNAQ